MENFSSQQLKFGKATGNCQQPGKGSARQSPHRAGFPAPPAAWPGGHGHCVHALSQAALSNESGAVICGVYCEWIANNVEAEV